MLLDNPYAFDSETFKKENSEYNEALVDNWKVIAIVAPRDMIEYASENPDMTGDQSFIYDLFGQFQVPVLDLDRNDMTSSLLAWEITVNHLRKYIRQIGDKQNAIDPEGSNGSKKIVNEKPLTSEERKEMIKSLSKKKD